MRLTKFTAAFAGVVLAGSLAACGGDSESEPEVVSDAEFDSGTTMAKLSDAGSMTVGTKFDQPGFGLLGLEDTPEGFDVEVAKIIAGAMGIAAVLGFNGLISGFGEQQLRISPFWNPYALENADPVELFAWTLQNRVGIILATAAILALAFMRANRRERMLGA